MTYLLLYGVSRFLLDFLRIWDTEYADKRYLNITPAQWVFMVLVFYALFVIIRRKQKNLKEINNKI